MALVLAILLIVAVFWDTHRIPAIVAMSILYLASAPRRCCVCVTEQTPPGRARSLARSPRSIK